MEVSNDVALERLKSACEVDQLDQQIGGAVDAIKARFAKYVAAINIRMLNLRQLD